MCRIPARAALIKKIKYPIETLQNRDGLCIETTVLVVSGLQTFIVKVPMANCEDSNTLDFVETALLGGESPFSYANSYAIDRYNEEA